MIFTENISGRRLPRSIFGWKAVVALVVLCLPLIFLGAFLMLLRPPKELMSVDQMEITVVKGDGLLEIAGKLKAEGFIRSKLAFVAYAVVSGAAKALQPGRYVIGGDMSTPQIVEFLTEILDEEVEVVIIEGMTVSEIERLLVERGVLRPGTLLAYEKQEGKKLEGYLFPDTYRFFLESGPAMVVARFNQAFNAKALPLLYGRPDRYEVLTVASILEKEVPHFEDRKVVAGILEKRLEAGWPLQVDAALCYVKPGKCYPLNAVDLKRDSPYNLYLYKGLPPTPIGNPGLEAIKAALAPQKSSYWFYLSDPETGNTVFAKTLEEHNENRARYLK